MIWNSDPSGWFKVSSIFKSKEKGNQPLWSQAWKKGHIPKINIFYWIMLQKKILTQDNLKKRGINVVNRCTPCKEGFKDRDHFSFNCSYSQQVWTSILNYWDITWVHQNMLSCVLKVGDVLLRILRLTFFGKLLFLISGGVSRKKEIIESLEIKKCQGGC